jgi:hypothetical protein
MTSWRSMVVMVVVLAATGCGGSSEPAAEPAGGATSSETAGAEAGAADESMATSEFVAQVTVAALPEVCADDSPLRTCYPAIDGPTCGTAFSQAMTACADGMSETLPPTVDGETADAVASAVATCARIAYQSGVEQAGIARTADCALER